MDKNSTLFKFFRPILVLKKLAILSVFIFGIAYSGLSQHSVARDWNELILQSIRNDFARPTVHARNLFHASAAMYDAWAVYDDIADPYLLGKTVDGFTCDFSGIDTPPNILDARHEAMSYAMYTLLVHRFQFSPGGFFSVFGYQSYMTSLGYDYNFTSTDYSTGSPAALGNYIGQSYIQFGLQDGSNEQIGYNNIAYQPVNAPMVMAFPGNPDLTNPNRWQPLTLDVFIDQSGNPIPINTPDFLSPEWGTVSPFALTDEDKTTYQRDGFDYHVYHDPGEPPYLDTTAVGGISEEYKWGFSLVSIWSSHMDPTDGVMVDISPASFGNIPMSDYPTDLAGLRDFYNYLEGGDPSTGHALNPKTGQPYAPQMVPRGDYARVLAEFWADGPESETPPGHWFTILNYVNDHAEFERRYKGEGPIMDNLEWDVKAYFIMGGAMHDAAITAWGIKGWYDYLRPVSAIRYMADLGQSSDSNLPSYHPGGILLEEGYIELVEAGDTIGEGDPIHIGKIKLKAWKGPDHITDPDTTQAGVGWILAENWYPYQRPTFVTPPFAGYVSGHSTYSRAAADVLTQLTGDEFFPGGMGEFEAPMNEFLVFEEGPSMDITLQWATYRDASDQTSLSRIWGGIHPPVDDIPGRLIGEEIAEDAFNFAETYFFIDADNDGFFYFEDCDDNNELINPNSPEICDGVDNDCNSLIDDGLTEYTYFADMDGDGFGNEGITTTSCYTVPPINFVDNALDCDDTVLEINPLITEICDGIDNNCDGLIDEGQPLNTYYKDNDGDGFGDANSIFEVCFLDAPTGYVVDNTDCDDNNSSIYPGANDVPDNGIDEDCSGVDLFMEKKIFPNPVRDELMIHYPYSGELIVQIINIDGRLISEETTMFQDNATELDLSGLAPAVYILNITDTSGARLYVKQFVKH